MTITRRSGARDRPRRENVPYKSPGCTEADMSLRRALAGTTALIGVVMLLGVFTAAEGAGLSCAQRWPLCDGPLAGFLPANYLSTVEWLHRVIAGIAGVAALVVTTIAWRRGAAARVRYALTGGLMLLPAQIYLGMLTVTSYEWAILVAHFTTAALIYATFVAGTAWRYGETSAVEVTAARARLAAITATGLLPLVGLLQPRLLFAFGSAIQVAYYAVALAAFAALVAGTAWLRAERTRAATGLAAAIVGGLLVLGRQTYGSRVAVGALVAVIIAFLLSAVSIRWAGQEVAVQRTTGLFSD